MRGGIKSANQKSSTAKSASNGLNANEIEMRREQNVDLKMENRELKTLNKTGEIERERLLDLVKTLQKRIEDLTDKGIDYENQLNSHKRKCVDLEKQLEKQKLNDSKSSASAYRIFNSLYNEKLLIYLIY